MIVVSVDLWPGGDGSRRRPLGTIDIARVDDGPPALYEVALHNHGGPVTHVTVEHELHTLTGGSL